MSVAIIRAFTRPAGRRLGAAAILASLFAAPLAQAVAMLPQRIIDAPENSWIKLNDNPWPSVWPDASQSALHGSPQGVVRAWSSLAWDSARGDAILWGGGHANYSGNEVYRWRSSTMRWELSSLPTAVSCSGRDCRTVDGAANSPISSHTYDNNEYLPVADRFITFGGNKYNLAGSFYMDGNPTGPYLWDPNRADGTKVGGLDGSNRDPSVLGGQMWENRGQWDSLSAETQQALLRQTQDSAAATAVVTVDGKDVVYQSRTKYLLKYTVNDVNDASQDEWKIVWDGEWHEGMWGQGAASINLVDNILVRTAGKKIYGFDLNPGASKSPFLIEPIDLTGRFNYDALRLMGQDYDAERNRILLWEGLRNIWSLTRNELGQWILDLVAPSNLIGGVNPYEQRVFTGILGKWKYAADWDLFVGMYNWENGDILAYKPAGWNPDLLAFALDVANTPAPAGLLLLLIGLWLLARARRRGWASRTPAAFLRDQPAAQ